MRNRLSLLLLLSVAVPLVAMAQTRFGYVSYSQVMQAMPDYIAARQQMADLEAQYQKEMKRVEDEFNKKYEEFALQQNALATPIRMKRQAELQEMMERNIAFKEEAHRLLGEAEQEALAPVRKRLDEAVRQVGDKGGYAFILNTDAGSVPYINPGCGEDITEKVTQRLAQAN